MIGETLSHYRVTAKLGQGGMGEVFLAEDTSLGRKVAVKVLAESIRQDPSARKRLLREAKLAAALDKAHQKGIIHRDLKPANIMLTPRSDLFSFGVVLHEMLSGEYDPYFPVETSQKPMFALFGTQLQDNARKTDPGGHMVPRLELAKETIAWLDRYLGSVK